MPARSIATRLQKLYNQPVIVNNRPGAGGNIGAKSVAKAKPDGYTLLLTGSGIVFNTALGTMPFTFPDEPTPIATIAEVPTVLTVSATVAAKTVDEFVFDPAGMPDAAVAESGIKAE